jgi:hypothetical protein
MNSKQRHIWNPAQKENGGGFVIKKEASKQATNQPNQPIQPTNHSKNLAEEIVVLSAEYTGPPPTFVSFSSSLPV